MTSVGHHPVSVSQSQIRETTTKNSNSNSNTSECSLVRSSSISVSSRHDSNSRRSQQGCSFSRQWLIHVAEETLQIANQGHYETTSGTIVNVRDDLLYAMEHSQHYHSSHVFHPSETTKPKFEHTEYHVCWGSSLQVARNLQEELIKQVPEHDFKIGVLNSASGKHPEKFLRGTVSQEEGICRATCLYPCLIQYRDRPHYFYHVNHKPKYQESSSSCAIYCPRVPVIRQDTFEGTLLETPQYLSFVNIPAPNAFVLGGGENDDNDTNGSNHRAVIPVAQKPGSDNESYDKMTIDMAMQDRIFRALSIFAEQGCTDLVLCAFGCGVHGNNPQKIAEIFRNLLETEFVGRFRVITFAIQTSRYSNFEAFCRTFGNQ